MKNSTKLIYLATIVLPFIWVIAIFALFLYLANSGGGGGPDRIFDFLPFIFISQIFIAIVFGVSTVLHIIHAARNPYIKDRIVFWIIMILLFGPFAMVPYWFKYIWPETPTPPPVQLRPMAPHERIRPEETRHDEPAPRDWR